MSAMPRACVKSGGVFLLSMTLKLLGFFYSVLRPKDVTGPTVQRDDGHKCPRTNFTSLRNLILHILHLPSPNKRCEFRNKSQRLGVKL
jgi:hypothetical protein